MTRRRALWLGGTLAALLALAALGFAWWSRSALDVTSPMPASSLLVADADLERLRQGPLAGLSADLLERYAPTERPREACGFDAIARIDRLALSIAGGQAGGLGIALAGRVTGDELSTCRAGLSHGASADPSAAKTIGSYMLTEGFVDGYAMSWGLADRGPLLLASTHWIEPMARAAASDHTGDAHHQLRTQLDQALDGSPRLLTISASLSTTIREHLESQLRPFLPEELDDRLHALRAVRSAGLSVSLTPKTQRLRLDMVLLTDDDGSADPLRELLLAVRLRAGQNLGVRFSGAGSLLDALRVETRGASVHAHTEQEAARFVELVDSLLPDGAP